MVSVSLPCGVSSVDQNLSAARLSWMPVSHVVTDSLYYWFQAGCQARPGSLAWGAADPTPGWGQGKAAAQRSVFDGRHCCSQIWEGKSATLGTLQTNAPRRSTNGTVRSETQTRSPPQRRANLVKKATGAFAGRQGRAVLTEGVQPALRGDLQSPGGKATSTTNPHLDRTFPTPGRRSPGCRTQPCP